MQAKTSNAEVIYNKIGPEYLFVFPHSYRADRTGKIAIGKTILIIYSIKVGNGRNSRFISLDASKTQITSSLKPELTEENPGKYIGFYVRDTSQDLLNVHLTPEFTRRVSGMARQEKIGREGNLNVVIGKGEKVKFKILRIEIN